MRVEFCNPFDEAVAKLGPPSVFLPDRKGFLRLDETWTRDAWGRVEREPAKGAVWLLLRDRGTGFVVMAYVTSPDLIETWPRADVRAYPSRAEAQAAREAFGNPPICEAAW